jgi:hypothetical protein
MSLSIPPNKELLIVAGLVGLVLIARSRKVAAAPKVGVMPTAPQAASNPFSDLVRQAQLLLNPASVPTDGGSRASGGFWYDPSYQNTGGPSSVIADTSATGSSPLPSTDGTTMDDGYGFGG